MILYYQRPPLCADVVIKFERKTAGASGFDLQADIPVALWLHVGKRVVIESGIYLDMPIGIGAESRPRSGMFRDHGVMAVIGTIDSDYRGPVGVQLVNLGERPYYIQPGDRVAQLVFEPVVVPGHSIPTFVDYQHSTNTWPDLYKVDALDQLSATHRGDGAFGSTGR